MRKSNLIDIGYRLYVRNGKLPLFRCNHCETGLLRHDARGHAQRCFGGTFADGDWAIMTHFRPDGVV